MTNDAALFLRRFWRHPGRVGAVAPSSAALAEHAVAPVPLTGDPVVVELGPGTGAFTAAIQRRLGGRGRHVALEVDPVFAELLGERYPRVEVVRAAAEELPGALAERGLAAADVVVSGLPWTLLPRPQVTRTIEAVAACIAPQGGFTTFAYVHARRTPPALRLRRELGRAFEELVPGRTVWRNLPPALVYHARRPRAQAPAGSPSAATGRKSASTSPSR